MQEILAGKTYKHFKGNMMEDMVVYESLRNNTLWVRPMSMWNEVVDDKGTLRFTLCE